MKNITIKILILPLLFFLLSTNIAALYAQQDPVLLMVCSHIKEGKDLDNVINILNQDLQNRPWNHNVRLYLGIAYFKKGDKELAFKQVNKIAEQVERMVGTNRPLLDSTDFTQDSTKPPTGDVRDIDVHQRRAQMVLSQENTGLFYFTYGLLLKLKGETKQAEKRFKSAIKAGYQESDIRFQLLDLYLANKKYKDAKKELSSLAKLNQAEEKILFLQGYLHHQDKKLKEAQACFEKAFSLKPDFLLAKKNLALLQYNTGNYQEAVRILQEVIQSYPDDKDAHINLGRAYFHNGEIEKAKEEFKAAGLAIAVENYSPKKVPLLLLQVTRDFEFKLNCGF